MEGIINVRINYEASTECQKLLIKAGKIASKEQILYIDVPTTDIDKLPVGVNKDGTVYLPVSEYHYSVLYNNTLHENQGAWGGKCDCCGTPLHGRELSQPIYTYADVQSVFAGNESRKNKVLEIIATNQRLVAMRESITVEVRKQLETEYQSPVRKLDAISDLIADKQRVRTAQIKQIIG